MSAFFGRNPNGGNRAPKKAPPKEDNEFEPFVSTTEENKKDSQEESSAKIEEKVETPSTSVETEKKEEAEKPEGDSEKPSDPEQENKPPAEGEKSDGEAPEIIVESTGETQAKEIVPNIFEGKVVDLEKPANKVDDFDIEEVKSEEAEEFGEPDLAEYFFEFLAAKELNVTLVGYFCRFFNILLMRRTTEVPQIPLITSRSLNIFGTSQKS
jgi:hypothetical protein